MKVEILHENRESKNGFFHITFKSGDWAAHDHVSDHRWTLVGIQSIGHSLRLAGLGFTIPFPSEAQARSLGGFLINGEGFDCIMLSSGGKTLVTLIERDVCRQYIKILF